MKNQATIKVVNEELFNSKVDDVCTEMVRGWRTEFSGDMTIRLKGGSTINVWGEFYYTDYVEEFGFELAKSE